MGFLVTVLEEAKPEGGITTLQGLLIAAIVALFGVILGLLKRNDTLHKVYGRKINELYDARITDLQRMSSKTSTVEDVTIKEIGTRKKKKKKYDDEEDIDEEESGDDE